MNEVYIAFGSNLGDRLKNIEEAVSILSEKIVDLKISGIYETEAEEMVAGHFHPFLNGVIHGKTLLTPPALLEFLQNTESRLGRVKNEKKGHFARTIDLDLLIFGDLVTSDHHLELPHPRLHQRLFVLKPLMDLNPELVIPGLNKKVGDLFGSLNLINN
jgi:2-amino-4-hydroxy-6-hydroxymethyldihydropteridine diphosphokinase